MRLVTGLFMCTLMGHAGLVFAAPPEWERLSVGGGDTAFVAVAADSSAASRVFAATARALFESSDGGRGWQERFRVPADTRITDIAVDQAERPRMLIATDHGLYGSSDGGVHWPRVRLGAGEGEERCTYVAFHPAQRDTALLGTQGGLFINHSDGGSWTEVRTPLEARDIVSFTFDATNPDRLYLITSQGLFVGNLAGGTWQQRFGLLDVQENAEEAGADEAEPNQPAEAEQPLRRLTSIAVDPNTSSGLYLAGSDGMLRSADGGATWQPLTRIGLTSPAISRLLAVAHSPLAIYAATAQGVARYEPEQERWQIITEGLATTQVNDLAATPRQMWAATDQGLYRYEVAPDPFSDSEPPSAHDLLANFSHEPTMAQVREAAIQYAEVHPEKIKRWRRQASLKALLPAVHLGMDHDTSRDLHVDEGSFPNFQLIDTRDRDAGMDLSITWDLGKLIWNEDQTSIDVRSKLMVQLRDDIVDEVTRTYFERRRLQIKLLTESPADRQVLLEKELRLQELTALIDGLTGGYFSQRITIKEN